MIAIISHPSPQYSYTILQFLLLYYLTHFNIWENIKTIVFESMNHNVLIKWLTTLLLCVPQNSSGMQESGRACDISVGLVMLTALVFAPLIIFMSHSINRLEYSPLVKTYSYWIKQSWVKPWNTASHQYILWRQKWKHNNQIHGVVCNEGDPHDYLPI